MMSSADIPTDFAATQAGRIGAELRAARQRLGWNLSDVAASLCLREAYVDAIEQGRPHDLPGDAYAVGFLRSYARLLGLDADDLAARYRADAAPSRAPDLTFLAPMPDRGLPSGLAVLLGLLLLLAAYLGWYAFSDHDGRAALIVPPVPARLAQLAQPGVDANAGMISPAVAAVMPANGLQAPDLVGPPLSAALPPHLAVQAHADCWIELRDRLSGAVVLAKLFRAGESWAVPSNQSLLLTTGNAGATDLVVDGAAGIRLGQPGTPRRDLRLDAEGLRQLAAQKAADKLGAQTAYAQPTSNSAMLNSTGRAVSQ